MYTVVVRVFNKYNEVEEEKDFTSPSLRGASIKAGKWMVAGWGKAGIKDMQINKRVSTATDTIMYWEIR